MYLKEIEYRFNHRTENLFKQFLKIYFGYVSPNYFSLFILIHHLSRSRGADFSIRRQRSPVNT